MRELAANCFIILCCVYVCHNFLAFLVKQGGSLEIRWASSPAEASDEVPEAPEEVEEFWMSGRNVENGEPDFTWQLIGIFPDRASAVDACFDDECFVARGTIDALLEEDPDAWSEWFYPLEVEGDVLSTMTPGEV